MRQLLTRALELQSVWSPENTSDMSERGRVIRTELPGAIRPFLRDAEVRWQVEGRDGTGLKSEIPWVRIFDPLSSPKATLGWYIVYLFDGPGNRVWLSLNQGTTSWINGEFQPRPAFELRDRVSWARELLHDLPTGSETSISLDSERTRLGAQYEAGNVVAFGYARTAMPSEEQLEKDLRVMLRLLRRLLQISADSFDEPGELAADLAMSVGLIEEAASARPRRLYRLGADERQAIERRAVDVAELHLRDLGFSVRDVGATESYDLHATKRKEILRVEVKGTVGDGSEVILTRNEVALHRLHFPNTMLAVVSKIRLDRAPLRATGGLLRTLRPWQPEPDLLSALAYSYQVPILD